MYTEESLRRSYEESKPKFERACNNIREALTIFLTGDAIPFLAVTTRVKDFDSFYEKVERKHYVSPFFDNEDFCGARIILYYMQDLGKVKELIKKEFKIQNNEDKSQILDVNEFGYRSHHFIVKFKDPWLTTPNYRGLQNVKIEIQVRTILMHAWAEIEHKLGYKNKEQIPNDLKRKLFMISAKLEEADGQFQELKENIENYKKALIVDASIKGKFASKEFNLNTFQALLDFYFPDLEKHVGAAADLFLYIQKQKIQIKDIIEYAEKIKPLIPAINSYIFGDQRNLVTHQSNIMSYAIEAFYEQSNISKASVERKKIIDKIRALTQ